MVRVGGLILCVVLLSASVLVTVSLCEDSSPEVHVKYMLSYLAGGECKEVEVSQLLLERGELMVQMTPKMEKLRKKVSFLLCQCYWARVRPDIVVSRCSADVLDSNIDTCIARIESEEGRMDYWQRFIEVNRFIFQLNAHLFSEAYKLEFADLTHRYQEIYQSQQQNAHLALQERALASHLRNNSLQLESSLKDLSHQLGPFLNLSSRLMRIGKSSWTLLQEAAEASDELKETFIFLALILGYTTFYIFLHLSTASCFASFHLYGWIRTVLTATMLIDWVFPFSYSFRTLFLLAGVIPISIGLQIVSIFIEKRAAAARSELENRQLDKLEKDGKYYLQWVTSLVSAASPPRHITNDTPPTPTISNDDDLSNLDLSPQNDENVPPRNPEPKRSKPPMTSPKASKKRG